MLLRITLIFFLISFSLNAHDSKKKKSLKAHEHGVGILNISQDNSVLLFEFEAPGYDIVGFEYKANKDEDIKKVENALNVLSDYKNIILPSASGDCIKDKSESKIVYEGNHSEFIAEYKLVCKNIANLKRIYIKYFNNFAYSKKLNIKILGKNKKTAYVASKSKKIIKLKDFFN